jgi:DNA-binding GntR family transcriptional regulator
VAKDSPNGEGDATQRAIEMVRHLITTRLLSPGEQIRQNELAEKINSSRTPLREALRALAAEGLVRHSPNQGYFVVRLTNREVRQIFAMRRLLETEILRTITPAPRRLIKRLTVLMNEMNDQATRMQIIERNRAFHFSIFELSPLKLIIAQLKPLWELSDSFRGAYMISSATLEQMHAEHARIVDRLEQHDITGVIGYHDRDRSRGEEANAALAPDDEAE